MLRHRKLLFILAILVLIVVPAISVSAATNPGSTYGGIGFTQDGGKTVILSASADGSCFLTIVVKTTDPGTYSTKLYDDTFTAFFSQDTVQGGAGNYTVTYQIAKPVAGKAPGYAVFVWKNGAPLAFVDFVIVLNGNECVSYLVDAQCAATAIIPHGAVVGALDAGGRGYWAPGKITPEVYINPGHYWVVDAYEDEDGHDWYELYISCQYIWVPAEWMHPTDDGPWDFQALPRPSNISSTVLATAGANAEAGN